MLLAPFTAPTPPGFVQVCTAANTDYPISIPAGAGGFVLWFELSATDPSVIAGRVGLATSATALTGLTGADTRLGYHPPQAVEYGLRGLNHRGDPVALTATHLHLACGTAGAVARGMWLFA